MPYEYNSTNSTIDHMHNIACKSLKLAKLILLVFLRLDYLSTYWYSNHRNSQWFEYYKKISEPDNNQRKYNIHIPLHRLCLCAWKIQHKRCVKRFIQANLVTPHVVWISRYAPLCCNIHAHVQWCINYNIKHYAVLKLLVLLSSILKDCYVLPRSLGMCTKSCGWNEYHYK